MGMFDWLRRKSAKKAADNKTKTTSSASSVQQKPKSPSKTTRYKASQSAPAAAPKKSKSRKTPTGNIKTVFPDGTRKVRTPDGREIFKPPAKKTASGQKATRYRYDRTKAKKKHTP